MQRYVSKASELIGAYVSGPLYTQLLQMDIYDISQADYYDACLVLDTVQTSAKACKKLVQAVDQAKDEEVAYREFRKESRGRVVGGGFGLGGALKGMATAGTINAVTGMGHSVVNAVGNVSSSISASNSKRSIYKDDDTFSFLCQAVIDCLNSTFLEHIQIANAHILARSMAHTLSFARFHRIMRF